MSPHMGGRLDINRYFSGCEVCLNYRTLPKGGARRRDGTLFIAEAKFSDKQCRLERFEFSVTQAYMLEIGHQYIRFYKDLGRIESGGSPVEATTPYDESDLFDLQMTQSADVLYFVHPDHPPAKLNRLSDTSWEYKAIQFRPMPSIEADTDLGTTLTLGALTGVGITVTAGSAVFLDGDVDRQIVSGDGRAVITALGGASPSATATVTIIKDFGALSIASGAWALTGSPAVNLSPDKSSPIGGLVTLSAQRILEDEPELVTNGGFDTGSGWTDHSAPLVSSGTATGGGDTTLTDTGATFQTDGVETGHIAYNTTDSTQDRVESVDSETQLTTPSGGATWAAGKAYEVKQTGTATIAGGELRLNGGENGVAWYEQGITTVVGRSYRLVFDVRGNPLSVMVGSTSKASDITSEGTYQIGNDHELTFVATTTTTYIQFRNNQNQQAVLDDVSVKTVSADAFRAADVGKMITMAGGVVEVTRIPDAATAEGVIWAALDDDSVVLAGAWVLGVASWSASRGYPRAISFHQGRLWFFGTTQEPLTGWGSVSGDYENFAAGVLDDDAVTVEISANAMNTIEWAEPFRDLFIGTRGGEHLITGGTNPITPTNRAQDPQDTEGSPPFRPIRIGNVLMHLQRGRRKVRELTVDADTGLVRARDVTQLADHITSGGITQWAYQRQPVQTIWAVRGDGTLLGFTFEILEEVRGWHRHTTDGVFESVAVLPIDSPSDDETEQVWCVVKRTINSADKRYIEAMRPESVTPTTRRAELTLDSALRYDGAAATVFSGLGHLEGETVSMVSRENKTITTLAGESITVDALTYLGTATVSGGQVTAPQSVTKIDIGLPYTSKLTTLRVEVPLQDGTIQMRKKRIVAAHARVLHSLGLTINGATLTAREASDAMDAGLEPHDVDFRALGLGWEKDGRTTIEQSLPLPSTVLCVAGELDVEEAD